MKRLHVEVPPLVRLKPGALDRLGLYLARADFRRAALFFSAGLSPPLRERARKSLEAHGVECLLAHEVREATVEEAVRQALAGCFVP